MTPSEALMWAIERDPVLRSTFLNITVLDRPPDVARLTRRIDETISAFPRMRQRVRGATMPWDRPAWIEDASFDLRYHVRHVALPPPGTMRSLLDLAGLWLEDAFDPVRPLWQLTVVEGLHDGRAALLAKMHHTITDGVGGLRLSSSFLDFDPDGDSPVRVPVPAGTPDHTGPPAGSTVASAARLGRRAAELARPDLFVRQARGVVDALASVARQSIGSPSGSDLWRDRRSMGRRLDTLDLSLDEARRTAKALGGTVNDYFVTGVTGGAAAYHRALGQPVERLRVAMPVSTRVDKSFGGNSFAPARVTVPVADPDPTSRFRLVHEALSVARSERALGMVDALATVILTLPPAVLTPIARQQVASVDLAASNLRGSPVELYMAGGRVEANYPMGPTAGVAFNATVLSYMDRLDMGLVVDAAAVEDPGLLRRCIEAEFTALSGAPAPA
jgi:diacylglycerol O-acyltransferase / wax synthase